MLRCSHVSRVYVTSVSGVWSHAAVNPSDAIPLGDVSDGALTEGRAAFMNMNETLPSALRLISVMGLPIYPPVLVLAAGTDTSVRASAPP